MIDLTDDFQVLTATICGEFDNQSLEAKQQGACSIVNRKALAHTRPHQFGDGTFKGVCLAPGQYNCWDPGPNRDRIMNLDLERPYPSLQDCMDVARDAIAGKLIDHTGGATHYYVPENKPKWSYPPALLCGEFDDSLFYKNA